MLELLTPEHYVFELKSGLRVEEIDDNFESDGSIMMSDALLIFYPNRKTPTSASGSDTPYSASVGVESPTEDSMFNFS